MDFLTRIWIVMNVAVLIVSLLSYALRSNVSLPDFAKDLATWGKTREDGNDKKQRFAWLKNSLLVPKGWFTHFYACGLVWNGYILYSFVKVFSEENPSLHGVLKFASTVNDNSRTARLDCFTVLLMLVLITFQVTRRFYESSFIASHSGKMHVIHYLVGLVFYGMVILSIIAEVPTSLNKGWCNSCLKPSLTTIQLHHLLALGLFIWANYHQYKCHVILGKLTAYTPGGKKAYKIPYGDWFEYVSSPHYFAEIIIYIALFLVMQGPSQRSLFLVLFVISNLSLGASITHDWYIKKFDSYPKTRSRIIPYVY